jgi:hypothetical protein
MPPRQPLSTLPNMSELHSLLDRLEARLDYQAARIDALYRTLDEHGLLAPAEPDPAQEELFDELLQVEDAPFAGSQAR